MDTMAVNERSAGLNGALIRQIKAEVAAADMPLGELARKSGIASRSLTRYLNFERDLTVDKLAALAGALEIDLDVLLRRARERAQQ